MNGKAYVVLAVLIVLLFLASGSKPSPLPTPDDVPSVPLDAPDFLGVFQEAVSAGRVDRRSAIAHAEALAGVCHTAGDIAEFDGKQAPPLIESARTFLAMRILLRHFREDGGTYSAPYPNLAAEIQTYLTKKVGRDDQEGLDQNTFTPELRAKYVDAYRGGMAPAFLRAAREIR